MPESTPPAKIDLTTMTDREILLMLAGEVPKINARLEEGNRRFAAIEADWTIAMNFMHEVAKERGNEDLARRIQEAVYERRPNGHYGDDEKTNPG
jgi:hypothetical protein